MSRLYDEIIEFIAGGTTPSEVAAFQASAETRARVLQLLDERKAGTLGADDEAELNHFLELEHLMRLAKARARGHMA